MSENKQMYVKPSMEVFSEEDIQAIATAAACSGCGGKCHRGSN